MEFCQVHYIPLCMCGCVCLFACVFLMFFRYIVSHFVCLFIATVDGEIKFISSLMCILLYTVDTLRTVTMLGLL